MLSCFLIRSRARAAARDCGEPRGKSAGLGAVAGNSSSLPFPCSNLAFIGSPATVDTNSIVPRDAPKLRTRWIGELRRLLARVCLATLKPDLIILDEFQRFKHLLEQESEAGELARDLFDSEAGQGARVLLLSATPYKSLSLHHEADDDHYGDFLALLRFLENS